MTPAVPASRVTQESLGPRTSGSSCARSHGTDSGTAGLFSSCALLPFHLYLTGGARTSLSHLETCTRAWHQLQRLGIKWGRESWCLSHLPFKTKCD